jgi:hypothetical protein
VMKGAVSAEGRLSVALRYLATGNSYKVLTFSTIISPKLLRRVVSETCAIIYEALTGKYMKLIKSLL